MKFLAVELFEDCCADLAAGAVTMKFLVFLFLLLLLDELPCSVLTSVEVYFAAALVSVFLNSFRVSVPAFTWLSVSVADKRIAASSVLGLLP